MVAKLKDILSSSNNIVFFGGAGVSTESNIPDFRSEKGLYQGDNGYKYSPEEMLSHSFFVSHKEDFYKFYKEKMIYKDAKPNAAHYALADLESMGKLRAVITQNIDGLHQEAGSRNVLELHGTVKDNYCTKCSEHFDLDYVMESKTLVPKCNICGGDIKPNVVLYEESLDEGVIKSAISYISNAEVLIVGGTSLVVYPAAGLINYFNGKYLVLINKSVTSFDNIADLVIKDKVGKVLGEAVSDLKKGY